MSICNSTNFLTFSNPISLNKTFSCKLILSLKISRRKVFIIKEDNSCVKLCWKMCCHRMCYLQWVTVRQKMYLLCTVHTEKYSPKSYVINLHMQMSSSQSGEQRWFSHMKKKRYVQWESQRCFFHLWEKWYVQSEATEVCEFSAKIPAFYRRLQLRRHAMRKVFFQRVFLLKKVKNILEIWVE